MKKTSLISTGRKTVFLSHILIAFLWLAAGCDQSVDEGDDKMTEGNQSLEVTFNGAAQTVHFDNLETKMMFENSPVVTVSDILIGSGFVVSDAALNDIWLNFVGTDGYSPIGNKNCTSPYAPTPGSLAHQIHIERGTCNMIWDAALNAEPCVVVKEVGEIQIANTEDGFDGDSDTDSDEDTDTDAPPDAVCVHHGEAKQHIDLSTVTPTTLDGVEVRLVRDIVQAAGMEIDWTKVALSFEGDDGYNPTEQGTCTEALPAPGTAAAEAGIEVSSGDLYWASALAYPGCASVKRVAIIYVDEL